MLMNIPTIIFWNPHYYELRDSAVPYFERLKRVGIFHVTPESAAQQLARVWDDVAAWWESQPVQAVRKEFCYHYSRMPEQPLEDIEQVLRQISKGGKAGTNIYDQFN
jgi:putative transferase (TIGR04331 family)